MAHTLRFTPSGDYGDPSVIGAVARKYVEAKRMHVSDMLDFMSDPSRADRLESLANWAAECGSDSDLHDIGKFGYWDCEDCGADELDIWTFGEECDEDKE